MRVVICECEYASFSILENATLVTNNIARNHDSDENFGQFRPQIGCIYSGSSGSSRSSSSN